MRGLTEQERLNANPSSRRKSNLEKKWGQSESLHSRHPIMRNAILTVCTCCANGCYCTD